MEKIELPLQAGRPEESDYKDAGGYLDALYESLGKVHEFGEDQEAGFIQALNGSEPASFHFDPQNGYYEDWTVVIPEKREVIVVQRDMSYADVDFHSTDPFDSESFSVQVYSYDEYAQNEDLKFSGAIKSLSGQN